jgi:ribosome-associated protein
MEKTSKTERKKQALSAQELGEKLVKLSKEQLAKIELPEDVRNAVALAKTIKKHGGRKRQMQYIGALMRRCDTAPIQEAIRNIEEGDREQVELLKQVERWRDELLRGNDTLLGELLSKLPNAEQKQLTDLVAKAREELIKKNVLPAASRLLFRHLLRTTQQA